MARIAPPFATHAEAGDVELLVGRAFLTAKIDGSPDEQRGSNG